MPGDCGVGREIILTTGGRLFVGHEHSELLQLLLKLVHCCGIVAPDLHMTSALKTVAKSVCITLEIDYMETLHIIIIMMSLTVCKFLPGKKTFEHLFVDGFRQVS